LDCLTKILQTNNNFFLIVRQPNVCQENRFISKRKEFSLQIPDFFLPSNEIKATKKTSLCLYELNKRFLKKKNFSQRLAEEERSLTTFWGLSF